MAESDEHRFITAAFLGALERLSTSRLYHYREAERGTFDFACGLERDWSRLLSGQTLWKHSEGIPKDLLYLLTENRASVVAYVARSTMRNQAAIYEFVERCEKSPLSGATGRLKVFWVPADFDADQEAQRTQMQRRLDEAVANDILLNVLFGRLSASDIRYFLAGAGISGLMLAILQTIAKMGFFNYPELAKTVEANPTTMRPRVANLLACGFLWAYPGESMYYASAKGRVFLDICNNIARRGEQLSDEMALILDLLDVAVPEGPPSDDPLAGFGLQSPEDTGQQLLAEIEAVTQFGVALDGPPYQVNDEELSNPRILLR